MKQMAGQLTRGARSQSAMEYLMTYGWAILIIAVVLGALYALGVFNAVNFMPKVPGGGCHVFRPNGPGTSWNVNLVGSCNNALPQYVAQFNGQSSYIQVPYSTLLNPQQFTVVLWAEVQGSVGTYRSPITSRATTPDSGYMVYADTNNHWEAQVGTGTMWSSFSTTSNATQGIWTQVVMMFDGTNLKLYINSKLVGSQSSSFASDLSSPLRIGAGMTEGTPTYYFNGSIANVQIYNTSLTANQVQYLYNEGIGGVPISPQYLVGWWPLNGDTNDYSGNNNNGAAAAVTFNGTWTSGYNVP